MKHDGGDLLPQVFTNSPSHHLAGVNLVAGEAVEADGLVEGEAELGRCGGRRIAIVNEGGANGPRDVPVLAVGPYAHQKFDVIERP